MATYKISDLLQRLYEISNDQYDFVEIRENEAFDDEPVFLSFQALGGAEDEAPDYEDVLSCGFFEDDEISYTLPVNPDAPMYEMPFTLNELYTIDHSLLNALEYIKECEKDSSYSKDVKDDMKRSSVEFRNLHAKLQQFFKHLR